MDRGRGVLVALLVGGAWIACGPVESAAGQTAANGGQGKTVCAPDAGKRLAGTWRAPQYRMKRASQAGIQVFGPDAFDVRDVELTMQPSGDGLLKISTSVVDAKKRTWAPTLIEANVTLGASEPTAAGRCQITVKVNSAQEQYLDETKYQAPIEGAEVRLLLDAGAKEMDLRFETPNGEGSFWTTVRRQAR